MTAKDLKNALLQEAVQGKLVPQIASEGNARDLLEEIRKEKAKLVKEGKLKKEKPLPELTEEEIPFDIPESWCWCRLGELISLLTDFSANGSYEKLDSNVKMYDEPNYALMIRTTDLENNDFTNHVKYIDQSAYNLLSKSTLFGNEIIMNKIGSAGKIYIMPCLNKPATLGRNAFLLRFYKFLNTNLIFDFLSTPYGSEKIQEHVHGAVTKTITKDDVKSILLPLPPLAEQKRIVAAIEKFMPLIEEYGKKETELKAFNEQIGTLTKKAILQEAVQGKLVPQIVAEGNATDLLEEIKKEKAKLIKEGKLKKEKTLPEITEDEIPFDIPENWCWCRLGDISTLVTKGTTPRGGNVAYSNEGIGFLRAENVAGIKELDLSNLKFIDEDTHQNFLKRSIINENDLLITIAGTLGRTAIVRKENLPLNANQAISIIRLVNYEIIDLNYLVFSINSPELQKKLIGQTKVTAIPNLTLEIIENCIIPLPPLAEQKRIVAAIEKMLPLCNKLGE